MSSDRYPVYRNNVVYAYLKKMKECTTIKPWKFNKSKTIRAAFD